MQESFHNAELAELRKRLLFNPGLVDQITAAHEARFTAWRNAADSNELASEPDRRATMRQRIIEDGKAELGRVDSRMASFPARHRMNLPAAMENTGTEWRTKLDAVIPLLRRGTAFVFHGTTRGTGKTLMATAAARYRAEAFGTPSRYAVLGDVFTSIKATFNGGPGTEAAIISELATVDFLVLDEVHEISSTEWQARLLTLLFDQRYRENRPTVLIANQDQPAFVAAVGLSIADRLMECGFFVSFDWQSFRGRAI